MFCILCKNSEIEKWSFLSNKIYNLLNKGIHFDFVSPPLQDPSAMPRPTSQDLAGFWELQQLSIDDVTAKFDELQQIKSNDWRLVERPDEKASC